MNKLLRHFKLITFFSFIIPSAAYSADIFKADKHFTAQQYKLATEEYLEAAKLGNPHAYYQLGTIYSKGLGVEKDPLNALIYFSMAAEYNFHNSEKIVMKILNSISPTGRKDITQILTNFKEKNGKQKINQQFFPQLITQNLNKKFTFDGQDFLEKKFYSDEFDSDDLAYEDVSYSSDDEEESESFYMPISTPRKPFLIIDHDIGLDGSKRNISEVQKSGSTFTLMNEYSLFPLPVPMFDSQATEFVHRAYMGSAVYNKFSLHDEDENLYRDIIRTVKKLKNSADIKDRYQYIMALQNFTWLEQEENEVEHGLLELAQQGHPGAMFEYGLKLYREQNNIPQAVYWIAEASKYGLARAEYRLGKLLTTSPWVEYDETKALFWFESATKKDHEAATLKTIELKLTARDPLLHDVYGAIDLLDKIAGTQHSNPEYFYLLAISHRKRENRDYTQVISNLEKAIFMGSNKNWDVAGWQELLAQLTRGSVSIVEE